MQKNNNMIVNIVIIIGIVFLIASLFLMLTKNKKIDNHIVDINYTEYSALIATDDYKIIILTSPTCSHCKSYKPYVNYVCDDYKIVAYDLDISTLSYDQYMEIHDKYSVTKNQNSDGIPSILTPTTIITKNGDEVDSISGDLGYSGFLELLKKNDIIKK